MNEAKKYFVDHEQMDFELQIALGNCYYGMADAGEVLAVADRLVEGDFESWVRAWQWMAERVEDYAGKSAEAGAQVSAREAYLRSASYYAGTLSMIDGSKDPSRRLPFWKKHLECFEQFLSRLAPAAEKVEIPYEGMTMPGYFLKPERVEGPLATIIFNNGSDGPTVAMWGCGAAGALRRGYTALIFDGPGQNGMLWERNVPFRHDWEKVITPVTDFLLARRDVDPRRIALSGISQGGYWVLRALAFEHRIAAGIADPGIMDVASMMKARFPQEMLDLVVSGRDEEFNAGMAYFMQQATPAQRQEMQWRMKPFATTSYAEWIRQTLKYEASEVIGQVKCPMFIADPEDEQFWPGQPAQVYRALRCPKVLVKFTREEGANWHCQPKARGLYDQRMFDWLSTVMPA